MVGPRRVLVASFLHEANSFTREVTASDVRVRAEPARGSAGCRLIEGIEEVLNRDPGLRVASGAWVEVLSGRGPLGRKAVDVVLDAVLSSVTNVAADALVLQVHGASLFEHHKPTEVLLLRRLRQQLGAEIPVIVVNDPHGNISGEWEGLTEAIISYKTTPHQDQRRTARRAAQFVLDAFRVPERELRPEVTTLPILVKGTLMSYTTTALQERPPFARLQHEARRLERTFGIADISINPGQAACDTADAGFSIVVNNPVTRASGRKAAERLRLMAWQLRSSMNARDALVPPRSAIATALGRTARTYLIDEGNDPAGGGTGNRREILEMLGEFGWPPAALCVSDTEVFNGLRNVPVGTTVSLLLPVTRPKRGFTAEFSGRVTALDGRLERACSTAVVVRRGETDVMVTAAGVLVDGPNTYKKGGLDLSGKSIVVVDALARPLFLRFRSGEDFIISVDTHGPSNPDLLQFPYARVNLWLRALYDALHPVLTEAQHLSTGLRDYADLVMVLPARQARTVSSRADFDEKDGPCRKGRDLQGHLLIMADPGAVEHGMQIRPKVASCPPGAPKTPVRSTAPVTGSQLGRSLRPRGPCG
jgi:microcystin degradation protein MlrC